LAVALAGLGYLLFLLIGLVLFFDDGGISFLGGRVGTFSDVGARWSFDDFE
jgi:hypothetical protein